jgi:hypothetical protein
MTPKLERGQSFVEMAIFMVIFIIIIAGIVELGSFFVDRANLVDASREAARFAADLDPAVYYSIIFNRNSPQFTRPLGPEDCEWVYDLWGSTTCWAEELAHGIDPDNGIDDIIITAWTVRNGIRVYNFPDNLGVWEPFSLTGNQVPKAFSDDVSSICAGYVSVEIWKAHPQLLGLPFFTVFVPDPIVMYERTIFPNNSAIGMCE